MPSTSTSDETTTAPRRAENGGSRSPITRVLMYTAASASGLTLLLSLATVVVASTH